jgi:3-dehydroquinate dehydratase / shikimate dehydrogenase
MQFPIINTERLSLRPWKAEDLAPFIAMNADPRVMEYFPAELVREESERLVNKIKKHFHIYGFGPWAVSLNKSEQFIGFIGLIQVDFAAAFTPAVEIGWRLSYDHWGKGYATEGALACLQFGFNQLMLQEIVSFTTTQNMRSRRVMEKIGMHHDSKDNFFHPKLPEGHPLRKHVLYRLKSCELQS